MNLITMLSLSSSALHSMFSTLISSYSLLSQLLLFSNPFNLPSPLFLFGQAAQLRLYRKLAHYISYSFNSSIHQFTSFSFLWKNQKFIVSNTALTSILLSQGSYTFNSRKQYSFSHFCFPKELLGIHYSKKSRDSLYSSNTYVGIVQKICFLYEYSHFCL